MMPSSLRLAARKESWEKTRMVLIGRPFMTACQQMGQRPPSECTLERWERLTFLHRKMKSISGKPLMLLLRPLSARLCFSRFFSQPLNRFALIREAIPIGAQVRRYSFPLMVWESSRNRLLNKRKTFLKRSFAFLVSRLTGEGRMAGFAWTRDAEKQKSHIF